MISILDAKALDGNAEHLGISVESLMENAGKELAEIISDRFPSKKVLFICGTGNNGGDGFVAARYLSADATFIKEPKSPLAIKNSKKIKIEPYSDSLIERYDVIVDCLLGTGIDKDIKGEYARCIEGINQSGKMIISCDVPSGLGMNCAVVPDMTVTFHDIKEGMNESNCGTIIIADIGIPSEAYDRVGPGDMVRYPKSGDNSHKGQNGRLLVIGGGPYIGAPAMSALAAARVGTDLIHIATPESSFTEISSFSPIFIMHKLPGDHVTEESVETLLGLSEKCDSVLIGPGLGTNPSTISAVRSFCTQCKKPIVIDADAITAMSGEHIRRNAPTIYTPHHSEYMRLCGDMDQMESSKELDSVIVLKGERDIITDGTRIRTNITGNAGMTSGGTGDVLAGIISGLLSKGMEPFDAGCLGTYICGKAGDLAFEEFSFGLLATDIIDYVAKVISKELM